MAGYSTLFMTNMIAVSYTVGITNVSPATATVMANHTLFGKSKIIKVQTRQIQDLKRNNHVQ
jgi:hypothetical protein